MVPVGRSRASNPSPVGIGVESPGQARGAARALSALAQRRRHTGVARFCPSIAALMSRPGRTRRAAPRGRRRRRCGAGARDRAAARLRAARRSPRRPADFRAAESRAPRGRRHRRRAARSNNSLGDRAGRLREGDQPVDGLGEFGGAARAVAHLPGDEARVDRARPHDARQRRRQRSRARPLRIGQVEHDEIDGAAEQFCRGGKAADEGCVLGAFQEIAAGIVARMHQKVGRGDALREGAGRGVAFAAGAAVGMRGGREIGRADAIARIGFAAEQIFDAGAVGARRGAEDAVEAGVPPTSPARRAAASGFSRRFRRARRRPARRHR